MVKPLPFGLRIEELLKRLDLGKSPSAWFAEHGNGEVRELSRWLNEGVLPRDDAWSLFCRRLKKTCPNDELDGELAQLKSAIAAERHIPKAHRLLAIKAWRGTAEADNDHAQKLTPTEPPDNEASLTLWKALTSTDLHRALDDSEWAWAAEPFPVGKSVEDICLIYHKAGPRYETSLDPLAKTALKEWRAKPENAKDAKKLKREPWGKQVRIESAGFSHSKHQFEMHLAPTKFLYYKAIQQNLWRNELRELRVHAFLNALHGLDNEEEMLLPANFSTHMAVVSSDGKALLRQRIKRTPLYPLAWEAGVGEFMHGPIRTKFRHFTPKGKPSLGLFLTKAVAEEMRYPHARMRDFRLYGIAAEYRTLAPKLIVVYSANIPIDRLMDGARNAKDGARNVDAIPLTVDGVAASLKNPKYRPWGPTSKLVLLLALVQHSGTDTVIEDLRREVGQVYERT